MKKHCCHCCECDEIRPLAFSTIKTEESSLRNCSLGEDERDSRFQGMDGYDRMWKAGAIWALQWVLGKKRTSPDTRFTYHWHAKYKPFQDMQEYNEREILRPFPEDEEKAIYDTSNKVTAKKRVSRRKKRK